MVISSEDSSIRALLGGYFGSEIGVEVSVQTPEAAQQEIFKHLQYNPFAW
jgi:hypothetical protein